MSRPSTQIRKPVVRPKKGLGQHFLTDQTIARNIVDALEGTGDGVLDVIEIGPGMECWPSTFLHAATYA